MGTLFLLGVVAANFLSPATPGWLAGCVQIAICILAGACIPAVITLLQKKVIARSWTVTTISFCLLFAFGSLDRLPVESDSAALEVFAIVSRDPHIKQGAIAQAAQNALQVPDHVKRMEAARSVYLLTGNLINYRDQGDNVVKFNPNPDDRARTESMLAGEQAVSDAASRLARGRFAIDLSKLLGIVALVLSMCIATLMFDKQT